MTPGALFGLGARTLARALGAAAAGIPFGALCGALFERREVVAVGTAATVRELHALERFRIESDPTDECLARAALDGLKTRGQQGRISAASTTLAAAARFSGSAHAGEAGNRRPSGACRVAGPTNVRVQSALLRLTAAGPGERRHQHETPARRIAPHRSTLALSLGPGLSVASLVVMAVLHSVDVTLSFALEMALSFELGDDVGVHVVERLDG